MWIDVGLLRGGLGAFLLFCGLIAMVAFGIALGAGLWRRVGFAVLFGVGWLALLIAANVLHFRRIKRSFRAASARRARDEA